MVAVLLRREASVKLVFRHPHFLVLEATQFLKMGDSPERRSGCGLMHAVKSNFWPRRATSTGSLPVSGVKSASGCDHRRRRGSSVQATFIEKSPANGAERATKHVTKPSQHSNRTPPMQPYQNQGRGTKPHHEAVVIVSGSGQGQQRGTKMAPSQGYVNQGKRVPKDAVGLSGELESMIADHQKSKRSSTFVRASSSNFMLTANLGNLRTGGGGGGNANMDNVLDYLPRTAREETPMIMNGNVGKSSASVNEEKKTQSTQPASFCRTISTRMDPETLKIMGNEDYKNGNFAEALSLYDAAIAIDPNKASYRSNKSASLTALGHILEAVFECREAIRIEPQFHRPHRRLATLYIRLGEAEKATYHFKHAGPEADQEDLAKVRNLEAHLNKCTEALRLRDWNTLIMATQNVIAAGADSAPQIFSLQAEALLKVRRHQEADEALSRGPNFEVDACTKYFGPISNASMLVTRAQVHLSAGRIDDALEAIQRARRLDSNNKEAPAVMRKVRAVAGARSKGNDLFKASKFSEACVAYGEGLQQDPYNSVLLCNRAACRSKIGQFDKAIEDCTAALCVRPSYRKARLRRADCNAKLEKWDASIQDYEILLKDTPDDEQVNRGLSEVLAQRKKQRGET